MELAEAKDSDSDGVGSIPAIPYARSVPLLRCHERFNATSLPAWSSNTGKTDRDWNRGPWTAERQAYRFT